VPEGSSMQPESRKHLFDIREAASRISRYAAGRSLEDYLTDDYLRSAVERQFEIIGEAMGRLLRTDRPTAERITEYPRIVSFRNQLIHGYDVIDDAIVWRIVEQKLPILVSEIRAMLAEDETPPATSPPTQSPPPL
jgi:uncharacterized protein with HEPN domain